MGKHTNQGLKKQNPVHQGMADGVKSIDLSGLLIYFRRDLIHRKAPIEAAPMKSNRTIVRALEFPTPWVREHKPVPSINIGPVPPGGTTPPPGLVFWQTPVRQVPPESLQPVPSRTKVQVAALQQAPPSHCSVPLITPLPQFPVVGLHTLGELVQV